MNLFNPDLSAQIGMFSLSEGIEVETSSALDNLTDWCKITIQGDIFSKIAINKNELVDVYIGYEGQKYNVFSGNTEQIDSTTIMCRDDMTKLAATKVTETFIDVTPQDIINYCMTNAGIQKTDISTDNHTIKSIFVINSKNIIDVLKLINATWNIQYKFYFQNRIFFWLKEAEANLKIFEYKYKENIISLKNSGGWMLESIASPFIKHSDIINIEHPLLTGQFKVKKIQNKYQEGFTRSYIYV